MNQQAIVPVLVFFAANRGLLNLDAISAKLRLHPTVVQGMVIDAEMKLPVGYKLDDWQVATLLDMGVRLGVIHRGTEFEIVPVQAELTIHEMYDPEDPGYLEIAKHSTVNQIAEHLHKQGVVQFDVIPYHKVVQRVQGDKDWKPKATIRVLKEK